MKSRLILISFIFLLWFKMQNFNSIIFVCGGGWCPEAFSEFHSMTPNFIILTANKDNILDEVYGNYEIYEVTSREMANEDELYNKIISANGILITGGDQAVYHREWGKTKLSEALQKMLGIIPFYLSSASSMIFSEYYFSAENGTYYGGDINKITIRHNFICLEALSNCIVDTHYSERNRQKRLKEFVDIIGCVGIGIDEGKCMKICGNTLYGNFHVVK